MKNPENYVPIIGLEVHAQLNTNSKLFSSDKNQYFASANKNISLFTLAHPGTLPMVNESVFPLAIKLGLSCHSKITRVNYFDRKNYFYPDLPKGFQITQNFTPICVGGYLDIFRKDHQKERVFLNRMHIEEDAGKTIHTAGATSHLNYNRAGIPLLEIVTEPCIHDAEVASVFLTDIRKRLRWLKVGNGNMEEGSLRCDVNISLKKESDTRLGTKVEIKNLNSIRNVQVIIKNEIERQKGLLRKGERVVALTRSFDAQTGTSIPLRSKEALNDYRYFPDPDITPYVVSDKMVEEIRHSLPLLPEDLYYKMINDYNLTYKEADFISHDKTTSDFFLETMKLVQAPKKITIWIMGIINMTCKKEKKHLSKAKFKPKHLAQLISSIESQIITATMAKQQVFPYLWKNGGTLQETIKKLNLEKSDFNQNIESVVDDVLSQFSDKVFQYKKGKKGLLQLFMGQCMRALRGKADAKKLKEIIENKLRKL